MLKLGTCLVLLNTLLCHDQDNHTYDTLARTSHLIN